MGWGACSRRLGLGLPWAVLRGLRVLPFCCRELAQESLSIKGRLLLCLVGIHGSFKAFWLHFSPISGSGKENNNHHPIATSVNFLKALGIVLHFHMKQAACVVVTWHCDNCTCPGVSFLSAILVFAMLFRGSVVL